MSQAAIRRALLASLVLGAAARPTAVRAARTGPAPGQARAGMLITGQSNAGFFIEDGGIWELNKGLSALLGIEEAAFDPRLDGFRQIAGYALRDGAHRDPAMATTSGGKPLWAPGDTDAFLLHRPDADPARWERGWVGQALDRFVRELLTETDRAACLGILWLHSETDSASKRMADVPTHAAAIRRHLALIRAAFGRPATGPRALPAFAWAPIPYGNSAEGHRAVRAALAAVLAEPGQNCHLALPQTADSEARGGTDWSHRDAADLQLFGRRAAFAVAGQIRAAGRPASGPRIGRAWAEGPRRTAIHVIHDGGRRLRASAAAGDGRGWSVFAAGARCAVTAMQITGPDRLLLHHEACGVGRREIGYCLEGEQLGRGNAVMDDWSAHATLPPGLGAEWRLDMPLQATLLPVLAEG